MEWISVEDAAPTESGNVLVFVDEESYGPFQDVVNAYICPEYGNLIWEDLEGDDYRRDITHWMPLPEPPNAS